MKQAVMRAKRYTGSTEPGITQREIQNRLVAREAAAEGFVLLKNDGVLPVEQPCKIALYGAGARQTIKGGTGSGDVYARETVSFEAGLRNAGYEITTPSWLNDFDRTNRRAKRVWSNRLLMNSLGKDIKTIIEYYLSHPYQVPDGRQITAMDIRDSKAEVAIYVIGRISGEGADRVDRKGDYQLTDTEFANLKLIAETYPKSIVILNTGGLIDMSFLDDIPGIRAVIYTLLPGMEGGSALADILRGACSPSGKLTDTWANQYHDYPSSQTFSHNDGNVSEEVYAEDIFVGYRYFDSFQVEPRFEFGFGKSYTDFSIQLLHFTYQDRRIAIRASVTNTGSRFSSKEVVQSYVSPPQGRLGKPYQVLAAFAKTRLLAPGESQTLDLEFDVADMASYDSVQAAWILEKGLYTVRLGNSSRAAAPAGYLELDQDLIIERVVNICPPRREIPRLSSPILEQPPRDPTRPCFKVSTESFPIRQCEVTIQDARQAAREITQQLSLEELATLVCGDSREFIGAIGNDSQSVPGASGETTFHLVEKYGLANIILADGPAGLRLNQEYSVDALGAIQSRNMLLSVLDLGPVMRRVLGLLGRRDKEDAKHSAKYYQYCTAMPIGSLLAQTWNVELVEKVGQALGREMTEFDVTLLLAPGMNIHRNPLGGRNFEYYSEDPLLTGKMAAALTRGVQSLPGVGTTLKHFTCNNQEANRNYVDSVLSERALREIYLKGFEIAVREAQPMAVMSSYNLVNGVRTANSRDLCTQALRTEWGFQGLVMTDWLATSEGQASVSACMEAGNDLMMPGMPGEVEQLVQAVKAGRLGLERLRECAVNVLHTILKSNRYEDCRPYSSVEQST